MELTGVTSQSIFDDNAADIKLSWVAGLEGADRAFDVEFAREATSAADLVGHLNLIHPNRIQVLGKPEITYYQRLDDEMRKRQMGELILLEPPFLVIADGMEPPPDLELRCTRSSTPLFTTPVSSAAVIDHLRLYLSRISAPRVTMHGVFLDILGMGVLIMGESGLGKSELGLELISRGHGLVADDAVDIYRTSQTALEGRCPELLQNLLEVRGIGLLDIKAIFGETAVRRKMRLQLIVHLVRTETLERDFERLPYEPLYEQVLDIPVRKVVIAVDAGRNLAVLVEAAVRNTVLQLRGIDTYQEFIRRHQKAMEGEDHEG